VVGLGPPSPAEESAPGSDYLAEICKEWEAAARQVPAGVRLVIIRTGIVLGRGGGVLAKMTPVFQLFAGGPLGSGQQWMSWIHRDDLVNLMVEALTNPGYQGGRGSLTSSAAVAQTRWSSQLLAALVHQRHCHLH